jgi:hypothetical protein
MSTPPVSRGLLKYLEETYPDRLPEEATTIQDVYFLMGQQRVIRNLRAIHKAQEEDALNGEPQRTGV